MTRTSSHRTVRDFLCGLAFALACAAGASAPSGAAEAPLRVEGTASPQPWQRYRDWPGTSWDKFNTLATLPSPAIGKERKIAGPITGDAKKGQALAFDRGRGGGCLACHIMGPATQSLPGNVGPDLSEIAKAGREDQWLFNYVYDGRVYNPETVMPPWGAHGVFNDDEIKDIVAFVKSLGTPTEFKNPLEDPAKRPVPVEERDNFDALLNPGMWAMETGEGLFKRPGPAGKACIACHADPAAAFKTWAAGMPKYEPRMKKVLGVEEFVMRHAAATTGDWHLMQGDENLALTIYLRFLAKDAPIKIDVTSPGAKAAAERGKKLMDRKIGQLNFACIDCHTPDKGALKWIRGQWLTESRGQVPHFPTWRTSRSQIWDIRKRFQWCGVAIRANELPPDAPEYGEIELYLTSLSDGLPVRVPGIRH